MENIKNTTEINVIENGNGCEINQNEVNNSNTVINNLKNDKMETTVNNQKSDNSSLEIKNSDIKSIISEMEDKLDDVFDSENEILIDEDDDMVDDLTITDLIEYVSDEMLYPDVKKTNTVESLQKTDTVVKKVNSKSKNVDSFVFYNDDDYKITSDDDKSTTDDTVKEKNDEVTESSKETKSKTSKKSKRNKKSNKKVKKVSETILETQSKSNRIVKSIIKIVDIERLSIHPLHNKIYLENDNVEDITKSMDGKKQTLTPIIVIVSEVNPNDYQIVSGVRRYNSYIQQNLKRIEVIVKKIDTDEILLTMIKGNIQRKKKCVEYLNEYDNLMEYYSHQGKKTCVSNKTNVKSRDMVCEMIGFSYSNINKLKNIQKVDSDKLSLIDDGIETINSVDKMCQVKKTIIKMKSETEIKDLNICDNDLFNIYKYDESNSLKSMEKKSVNCIITTPPNFNCESDNRNSYIESVCNRLTECYSLLKDDGNLFLIMMDSKNKDGEMTHIPNRVISKLLNIGYHHVDTIIWEYTNSDSLHINHKQLIPSFKYIIHLTKTMEYYMTGFRNHRKNVIPTNPNGNTENELFQKYQSYKGKEWGSVWLSDNFIKTTKYDLTESESSSTILQKIPIGLILDTTKENDVVFNPYNDNESVGCVSIFYGRKFIGYTDSEDTLKLMTHKLNEFSNQYKMVG